MRATVSWRRAVRAQVGLLEDVVGRPEADQVRAMAMSVLGYGLFEADHYEEAVTVQEAELSLGRRYGCRYNSSPCRAILRTRINFLGGSNRPCVCDGTYTPDV